MTRPSYTEAELAHLAHYERELAELMARRPFAVTDQIEKLIAVTKKCIAAIHAAAEARAAERQVA